MKTVKVNEENWKKLFMIKLKKNFKTIDDVISYLLSKD